MKNKLGKLFDFQRFEKNPHLQDVIDATESKYSVTALSDDDLAFVNAAGDYEELFIEPYVVDPDPWFNSELDPDNDLAVIDP